MDFLNTDLGTLLWKAICTIVFLGLMIALVKSALASWKKSGKIINVLDEFVEGLIVLVIFIVFITNDPNTIVNAIKTPFIYLWNIFIKFISQITGIPI